MTENEISKMVFDAGLKIHRKLGCGLYENVYEECLYYELKNAGLLVDRQKSLSIAYENLEIPNAFRMDLVVEDLVVLEIKSVDYLTTFHSTQLKNYLKFGKYKLGMLLNFNQGLFKDGVKRIANGL